MPPAAGHTLRPAIVDIVFTVGAEAKVTIQANAEALIAGIGPQHEDSEDAPQAETYDRLRALDPAALAEAFTRFEPDYGASLRLRFDGRTADLSFAGIDVPPVGDVRDARLSVIHYTASIPAGASTADARYPARYGDAVIRFSVAGDAAATSFWLTDGAESPPVRMAAELAPRSLRDVALDYVSLGFTHIVPLGMDHILFVLGLFLLSVKWRPLLWQITAFTVAHTITLGLSIYGLVAIPASVVEPLIAVSIAYIGIENLVVRTLHAWRVVIVFAFGLLHGLGFGGVLLDLGLPAHDFVTALVAFNVGVELGQLAVIAGAFVAVGWLSRNAAIYRRFVVIPGSLAIAAAGLAWTVERLSPVAG